MTATAQQGKLTQSEILAKLGFPTTDYHELLGNGKLQQYLNQRAALKGLPQPFNPSLASTIVQDVLPLAAMAGAAAATAGEEAASGGAAAGGGSAGAAGAGAKALGTATKLAAGVGVIGFLSDPNTWIRLAELIGGIALILMGLRSLTGSTTTPVMVAKNAAKAAVVA